ncbi:MAG: hypothetical protein V7K47_04365 [Nostoc sp.]
MPAVQQLVDQQPDAILSELCERLAERSGINISISIMHRAVQRLELTNKKTLYASEQDSPRIKQMRYTAIFR